METKTNIRASAIITTFNRKILLEKAMRSVLAQTFQDFELIILDNSSKDGTEELVKKMAAEDSRIVYVRHPQLNIAQARNLGVRTARGEFLGFLDDDDEWLPRKLELQVGLFDKSPASVALVYGGFNRVTTSGEIYNTFTPRLRGKVFDGYFCGHDPLTGSASNPLIRKSAFDVSGLYDENIKSSEDWEMYLRLARDFEFEYVKEPVVDIRAHAGPRLGDKLEDAAQAEIIACGKFADYLAAHPTCRSYYLQTIGGKYCRVGKAAVGRRYLREAITVAPGNTVARVQILLSYLGAPTYRWFHKTYQRMRKG
jgi:glycosyltransferase involved in cell wall biosynthesis